MQGYTVASAAGIQITWKLIHDNRTMRECMVIGTKDGITLRMVSTCKKHVSKTCLLKRTIECLSDDVRELERAMQ